MSSQQLASNNGPNRKVPICNLHRLPMRQFSVKKEGPNKGKLFWNCQQAGDFCKSFLWDHDIESKPNSWKLEFLVNPDNNSESRPAIASAYKLVFELVTRGHIEAKILPALQDKSLAAAVSEFVTGNPHPNNPCCWRIPTHHYHAFLNVITKNLAQYNVEVSSLPEWIMKRYVEGAVVPKTFAFDKNRVPKELWSRLLPFQRDGVQQIVAKFDGRCIIADEMGLGKTVQAVALMSYYGDDLPALIVAPSSIRFHWKDTLLNWLPNLDEERIHVINSGTDWPKYEDSINFMIISYALLSKFQTKIQSWNPSFVVLDESHFIKTLTTQRSLAAAPIIKSSRRAILLSGTPATSRPSELFSQVDVLHHGMLGSYKQYGIRYCDGREGNFGWECRGARCLRELNLLLTDAVMIRRLKKDVMQDLPPKFRSGITISSLPASAAAEFKLKLKAIKGLESGTSENNGILATLYHDTGVVKIKDAASFVTTKLDSSDSEKFLIFAHHQDVIDGIENELRKGAASGSIVTRIDGNTNMVSRKSIVEKFQSDSRYRVLILSIKSASFGITLTAASNVLFAELAWSPQDLLQAEDRAHRIGQEKSHVNISYLLAKGTLDDIMWPMIQRKLSVCNTTIDAGRGDIINVDFQNDRSEIEQQRAPKRQRNGSISVRGPMDQFVSSTPRFKSDDLTQQSRSQSSADDVKDQIDLSQSSCSQPISSTQGSSKSRTHSLSLDVVDLT